MLTPTPTPHQHKQQGQIHRGADTLGEKHGHPRLTAPPQSAELFLQAEDLTAPYYLDTNCRNAVMGERYLGGLWVGRNACVRA